MSRYSTFVFPPATFAFILFCSMLDSILLHSVSRLSVSLSLYLFVCMCICLYFVLSHFLHCRAESVLAHYNELHDCCSVIVTVMTLCSSCVVCVLMLPGCLPVGLPTSCLTVSPRFDALNCANVQYKSSAEERPIAGMIAWPICRCTYAAFTAIVRLKLRI